MNNYKDTLNLPKTSFSMKANLSYKEPIIFNKWEEQNIYLKIRKHFLGRKKFILHDGPPYANGNIHVGHALNKILKDIIIKAKTLSGYDAPYIPTWDCHGLPIELKIEQKYGKVGQGISKDIFRKRCYEYAKKQVEIQKHDFKRLGVIGDWERPYLTTSLNYKANIIRTLAKIINNGHLIKGFKPINWCIECSSALAEAEIEYIEKISPSLDIKFKIKDKNQIMKAFNLHNLIYDAFAIVWTTTPWTLPANQAIAINKKLNYTLIKIKNYYIILAENIIKQNFKKYNINNYKIIAKTSGKNLIGIIVQHPFYDNHYVSILHSNHVTDNSGTGIVHIAPNHGIEDFNLGKIYNLSLETFIEENGYYKNNTKIFAGEFIFEANNKIINLLKRKKYLINCSNIKHSYPHCWRHKTPTIFRATEQWFISMEKNGLRNKAIKAIKEIKWTPKWGQERIEKMIKDRPDWCISRQRTWGVPLPLFINNKTKEIHQNTVEILNKIADKIEYEDIKSWFTYSSKFIIKNTEYKPVKDILDVWFDSGSSSICVLDVDKALQYPADLYLEGSDQHRGWFQTSLLVAISAKNSKPYKEVFTHGFVVDKNGRKMSKSIGNIISPQDICNTFGADILRLWTASSNYKNEIMISNQILKRTSDIYRKLRNTARFLLANLYEFNPNTSIINFNELIKIDQWAIAQTKEFQDQIIKAYNNYQTNIVIQLIHNFCSIEMGSFYLDIIKDRQYTLKKNGYSRKSSQTAIYHIINALVRWIAPILSFTADEIWEYIPKTIDLPIQLCEWYDELKSFDINSELNLEYWRKIKLIKSEINKILEIKKNKNIIKTSLESEIIIYTNQDNYNILKKLGNEIKFLLISSKVILKDLKYKSNNAINTNIDNLFIEINTIKDPKCNRCWHHSSSIGENKKYQDICNRCIENISTTNGELREFI